MAGEDRGPLLAEFDDGTKIYRNGILKSEVFFEVSFFNMKYESTYDFNAAAWGKLEQQDQKLEIPSGSATIIELAPGEDGDLVFNGGQIGGTVRGIEAALVYNEKGEIDHLLMSAGLETKIGGAKIGLKLQDDGNNLSLYNSITVQPNGTVIKTVHTPGNVNYEYIKVEISIYNANGDLVQQLINHIADPDIAARMGAGDPTLRGVSQCFGPEVPIDMWPLDLDLKPGPDGPYDQNAVRAKIWKKPIERIRVGDIVVSFDKNGNLVPGPVTRTFQNTAKILLNFHGTRVTPGHVYHRADSKRHHKFETLIDILRDDGIIQHQDGALVRAATNVPVGSPRDGFVRAITGTRKPDGTFEQTDAGRIRLGTRFLVGSGPERKSFAVADLIEAGGGVVGHDELIRVGDGEPMPFLWDFGTALPKPEDFVLACSGTSLEDIYMAAEWEGQGPRLPAPMVLDRGPVQPLTGAALSAMPRNEPLNVVHVPMASAQPQNRLNRKPSKAMDAKQGKPTKSDKRIVG